MRSFSNRGLLAAMVAVAAGAAATSGSATLQHSMNSGGPMPVIAGMGRNTNSPNRRAPGAHKAAHRAAMKLRRIKKHRARAKNS
jgi:hypothetical protein